MLMTSAWVPNLNPFLILRGPGITNWQLYQTLTAVGIFSVSSNAFVTRSRAFPKKSSTKTIHICSLSASLSVGLTYHSHLIQLDAIPSPQTQKPR